MSRSNPNVDKPLTREQQDGAVKAALELFDEFPAEVLTLRGEEAERNASESADHLRRLFPEVDDRTLAGFAAYAFMNLAGAWSARDDSCPDLLVTALHFGAMAKQLAALTLAPEAPEKP